MPFSRNRIIA
nr:TPA_asm: M105 uORF [Murid betaherpesvirus 1]DBA07878.1 TPA_asm: M105 uORF [Murid betaherpesvirus 1]